MLYGLYLSAQGAEAQAMRQTIVANNLANAGTTSFKRDLAVFRAHQPHDRLNGERAEPPPTINDQTGGVTLDSTLIDYSQGSLRETGGRFDLALLGPGLLEVTDGTTTSWTRDGRLTRTADGELVTANGGLKVLGEDGNSIELPLEATDLEIGADGRVYAIDALSQRLEVGQLRLREPVDPVQLIKLGDNRYSSIGDMIPAESTVVRQGSVEESGTRPLLETLELIESSRNFEMNMNLIKMQDEMLGQLLQAAPL
ncbi:MAG: flagellar hook basal-body protein [Planctomycetaceae bacterium]|nr:flagellar hook basal-body protein [Planctomycetaceae bacterium]